ncbi:MAG: 16S rRNA (cytosine(967)-C(5))-methyltransferase RsmB [Oscillospiraceae bacterium]|nr:16S rRNA (cytosine(967)-C(5))-methyltransferase RsmB [Oscillospiraceae bacterium]
MNNVKLSAREACLKSLAHCEEKKYSNIELSEAVEKYDFNDLERRLFTKLFMGVIEKKLTLDHYIKNSCEKNTKLETDILNILRMGAYQIAYLDKVPNFAICDESVKLAKKARPKNPKIGGVANAILRNFIRNKENILKSVDEIKDPLSRLEIKYSCNRDIIETWNISYGKDAAEKLLEETRRPHALTLAVNTLKISRDQYFEQFILNHPKIAARMSEMSPYGIIIEGDIQIKSIFGFESGLFFVQDESSQICAMETGAKPGDLVVDCCAAPGGKSFIMAQMMQNFGRIVCFDIHEKKLARIDDSAHRLGIKIIETQHRDSTLGFCDFLADAVLCDVPCSGLGTVSKKPEIKYKTLEEISDLPKTQLAILSACSNYVKPGGALMYSTCTLNKKENEEVADRFLSENKDFSCDAQKTFFPFEHGTDGFFYAKLKRRGNRHG